MAKKKVNNSQAIRDYAIANPGASVKQVVKALTRRNIEVPVATVPAVNSKTFRVFPVICLSAIQTLGFRHDFLAQRVNRRINSLDRIGTFGQFSPLATP